MRACAQSVYMATGKRLSWFRVKAGHTQDSLAVASGISRKRISEIEGDKGSPSIETLEALLKPCNASLAEFFYSDLSIEQDSSKHADIFHKVELMLKNPNDAVFVERLVFAIFENSLSIKREKPRVSESNIHYLDSDAPLPAKLVRVRYYDAIPAGDPREMNPDGQMWIDIVHSKAKESWYTLRISGDSMEPSYVEGDIILMDYAKQLKNGDIVAALIDGRENTLKIYSRKGDEITLTPVNAGNHKVNKYHAGRVSIQGVLVELVRRSPQHKR